MWILTAIGFFSVVQKPSDKEADTLTVRARVEDDLIALKEIYLPELSEIQSSVRTDYKFRATYPSRKHTYPARERAGMIVSTPIDADTYKL